MIKTDNLSEDKKYDIVIIGAGPAGIMAAISAAIASASAPGNGGLSICILERNQSAARKLLLTGNGRCNYTANIDMDGMLSAFGKKGRFFSEAFDEFSNRDLVAFFEAEGIEPEYEKSDENEAVIKVFPKNKNASSVRQCLIDKLQEYRVNVFFNFRVEKVIEAKNLAEPNENYFFEILQCSGSEFDNHLNNGMRNNLRKDAIGTSNVSCSNQDANMSGAVRPAIGAYVSEKSSINDYELNRKPFSLFARKVILATGGITYPHTGSTGDGYAIAKKMGHSVNELIPCLVPVFSKDSDIVLLAGVSVKEVGLKILSGKKVIAKSTGSVLFTHKGLSGPCAVSIGHEVFKFISTKYKKDLTGNDDSLVDMPGPNQYNEKNLTEDRTGSNKNIKQNSGPELIWDFDPNSLKNCRQHSSQGHDRGLIQDYKSDFNTDFLVASLDLAPDLSLEGFKKEISNIYKSNPKKELLTILNIILKNVPQRLLDLVLIRCSITKNLKIGNLSKEGLTGIYDNLKNLEFKIDNDLHFEEAIVTEGGIPAKEISPRNMQSVLKSGLYFAGEIIELAGPEGGFNLQKAFSTGWLAGKSAAESLR